MSEEHRKPLNPAVQKYYYDCPRCESTATAMIHFDTLDVAHVGKFIIYKWVCQECCHVFELMKPEDVRELTGWVD